MSHLTMNIWIDRSMHSFLVITAHSIVNCTPLSGLLTFSTFTRSHTGIRIAEEIEKDLTDNHLETKVSCTIAKNASNMNRAFDVLKELQEESPAAECAAADGKEADENMLDDDTFWEDFDDEEDLDVGQDRNDLIQF